MRTLLIVQARMGSTRLPGKILKKVMGKPLLEYQIERLRQVPSAADIVVATTEKDNDNEIVQFCEEKGVNVFRGSENDVLARFYGAAKKFDGDCIVRVNSDCPLIDPIVVSKVISEFHNNIDKYDYVSNILKPTYPIGMHTEVFPMASLATSFRLAKDPLEREHVTPYIYRNPKLFRLKNVSYHENLSHYRWTLDFPEDFVLIEKIISSLHPINKNFEVIDVINLLNENPEWNSINSHIKKEQTV